MFPLKALVLPGLMALWAAANAVDAQPQPAPPESRPSSPTPSSTPPAPAPGPTVTAPAPRVDPFVPSETISADASVSFPVDI